MLLDLDPRSCFLLMAAAPGLPNHEAGIAGTGEALHDDVILAIDIEKEDEEDLI